MNVNEMSYSVPVTIPSVRVYTPHEVYGNRLSIPTDYRIKAFGQVKHGDTYLSIMGFVIVAVGAYSPTEPRLILEPASKPRRWMLEETGEVRVPNYGELYISNDGEVWRRLYYLGESYPILKLREVKD